MNKNIVIVSLLLFLNVLIGILIVQKNEVFERLPHKNDFSLEDATTAIVDENKNVVFIDKNKQRVVKLNSASTVQFELTDYSKNRNYKFHNVAVDQKGMIYVHVIDYEPFSENIQTEKIVRYTAEGKFDKEIFSLSGNETEKQIKSLHLINDEMLLLMQIGQNISFRSVNVTTNDVEMLIEQTVPSDLYIYEMTGISDESILFSTKTGDIYQLKDGGVKLLYESKEREIGRGVPEHLAIGFREEAYFFDAHKREIVRMNVNNGTEQTFLKEGDIQKQGYSISFTNLQSLKHNENGYFAITHPDRIVVIDRHGLVDGIFERGYFGQNTIFFQWFIWMLPFFLLLLLLYTFWFIYANVMQKKVSLMIKFTLLYVVTVALAIGGLSYITYNNFANELTEKLRAEINNVSHLLEGTIDGDVIQKITSPKQYMSGDYLQLVKMGVMQNYDINVYKYEHGKLYTLASERESMFTPHELTVDERLILRGETGVENEENELTVYRPILSSSGEAVGLIKIIGNERYIENEKRKWFDSFLDDLLIVGGIACLLFILITIYFILPIRSLTKGVQEIAKGKWETAISINRLDEVGILSHQVDRMTDYVKDHIDKITALNDSYYRFVPQQFLQFLGKETLLDVQLGDHTEQVKTILMFKMRSFYTFSKQLTPEENFKFINSFLSHFSPIIREHNGMINKYFGPGGLSLFAADAEEAVISAIEMRKKLYVYNGYRKNCNYRPIEIGIAIHKGPVMLGIIGGKDRVEGAVISDDVNLTEVLENYSEILGVSIITTQSVIDDVKDKENIMYRNLGIVNVSERDEPIQLYDIFHGDPENIRRLKEDTKEMFERGIYLYQDGRFYDARSTFINVIKHNPHDKVAKLYFYLCDEYFQKGTPKDWNGNLIITDDEQIDWHKEIVYL